ncbi:MAG: GspH/FimT family pseudopilin [Pseudomonadota bacterium]|nr:GspH/FimT family pseudopilin [Pseudomonadota bacterium]HPX18744.1 GspH/FimT family pseudopilin [Deltaproteobacteria bacterium]HRV35795.1 GspH/FimT family pseudopilin [Desulfomonilia bacterium]
MHGKCNTQRPEQVGSHRREDDGSGIAGVTLLELLAVLCIASILAVMALPDLGKLLSRKSLSSQADKIALSLHRARDLAMEQGHDWKVVFHPAEGTWVCFGDADGDSEMDETEQRLGPDRLDRKVCFGCVSGTGPNGTVVPGDGISFVDNRISYSPLGCCNSGSIYIRSEDRSMAIRVLPASGAVRMWEYRGAWEALP